MHPPPKPEQLHWPSFSPVPFERSSWPSPFLRLLPFRLGTSPTFLWWPPRSWLSPLYSCGVCASVRREWQQSVRIHPSPSPILPFVQPHACYCVWRELPAPTCSHTRWSSGFRRCARQHRPELFDLLVKLLPLAGKAVNSGFNDFRRHFELHICGNPVVFLSDEPDSMVHQ